MRRYQTVRAIHGSREIRPHEPMQSLRCFAAMEESYPFVPTSDVLWTTTSPAGLTEATTSVSALAGDVVVFVIGRGPSHEVEQSDLSRAMKRTEA
jgi:hypothetical protein